MAINPVQYPNVAPIPKAPPAPKVTDAKPVAFDKALSDLLHDVNLTQMAANQSVQDLVAGKTDNLHEVMIAMGKAQVSFQFMAEVRNKLLDAYREIMRMQL